jgi:hypothetical protein
MSNRVADQEKAYADRARALGAITKANQARQVDNRITFPATLRYNAMKVPARHPDRRMRPPQ